MFAWMRSKDEERIMITLEELALKADINCPQCDSIPDLLEMIVLDGFCNDCRAEVEIWTGKDGITKGHTVRWSDINIRGYCPECDEEITYPLTGQCEVCDSELLVKHD
jgi:Zn finger protein HypA/HybF involved in hydrogenase expression